ncbi:unnamed protein product [Cuscuta europaea]|uniref:C2 domain-containing protein n=1 Tax=Cuscuta europaea TaxID=41803 RepID=A0A9P0ZLZ4_CUSEU|nr:unnamed protein product [Cuscuta europaea]
MNPMTLEVTIKSADVFKKINRFGKMQLYTTATLHGSNRGSPAECRTKADGLGGSRPLWDTLASFRVDESEIDTDRLVLVCEVKCKKCLVPNTSVGTVNIPVKELFQQSHQRQSFFPEEEDVAFVISSEMGKPRGVLYLSYLFRINGLVDFSPFHAPSAPPLCPSQEDGE